MTSQNKISQEHDEEFYLKNFLSLINWNDSSIARGDDPPDYIIVSPQKKKIATEITEFHSDATGEGGIPRRSIEETWKKLQDAISQERKAYNEFDDIACYLRFSKLKVPPKREHREFANQLLSFVKEKLKDVSGFHQDFEPPDKSLLTEYLKFVRIAKVNCYYTWEWNHSGGMVGLNEVELINIVKAKSKSVGDGYDQTWLLIVSGHTISQNMGIVYVEDLKGFNELNDALSKSQYDEVFIYQYMLDRVLEWSKDYSFKWLIKVKSKFDK